MTEKICKCMRRMRVWGIVKGPKDVFWRVWICDGCGNVEKVVRNE